MYIVGGGCRGTCTPTHTHMYTHTQKVSIPPSSTSKHLKLWKVPPKVRICNGEAFQPLEDRPVFSKVNDTTDKLQGPPSRQLSITFRENFPE